MVRLDSSAILIHRTLKFRMFHVKHLFYRNFIGKIFISYFINYFAGGGKSLNYCKHRIIERQTHKSHGEAICLAAGAFQQTSLAQNLGTEMFQFGKF